MTYIANPKHYSREDFAAYIGGLTWSKGWKPAFPTLHNTGAPNLRQWQGYGDTVQERWGASLNRYYQGLGWHSGPHLVCCPDYIWVLCDPEQDGVSVSCWNHVTFGIEMVGDYSDGADDPTTGDGLKVVENAVFAIATLAKKLGWSVGTIVQGVGGLHFHRECVRDGHPCPGDRIDKADIVKRVLAQIGPTVPQVPPPDLSVSAAQALKAAVIAFQKAAGLAADGDPGPATRAALASALSGNTKP